MFLYQKFDQFVVARLGCQVKWCQSKLRLGVDKSFVLQQDISHFCMAIL